MFLFIRKNYLKTAPETAYDTPPAEALICSNFSWLFQRLRDGHAHLTSLKPLKYLFSHVNDLAYHPSAALNDLPASENKLKSRRLHRPLNGVAAKIKQLQDLGHVVRQHARAKNTRGSSRNRGSACNRILTLL